MLYSMSYLRGLPLLCKGEEYGVCDDFYFEDGTWMLRHLVASDGAFVFKKRSLVSPESIERIEMGSMDDAIPLSISKRALELAPDFDGDVPFSRAIELAAIEHYHLSPYWLATGVDGTVGMEAGAPVSESLPTESEPNLRSLDEVLGYDVRNDETSLGKACDLILDITDYSVAYLAVDTKPGEQGGVRLISTTQKDIALSIEYASRSFMTECSSYHLSESPSADLSEGRLSLGDQQKIDLSSY